MHYLPLTLLCLENVLHLFSRTGKTTQSRYVGRDILGIRSVWSILPVSTLARLRLFDFSNFYALAASNAALFQKSPSFIQ